MNTGNYKYQIKSFATIYRVSKLSKIKYWFFGFITLLAIILFLPWTQNVKSKGAVTTLYQDQRPQKINSYIAGKIVKWSVKEGDDIRKGDTILQIVEIKSEYLDPELVGRTEEQLAAKKASVGFYDNKVKAYSNQISILNNSKGFKLAQVKNKTVQVNNKLEGEMAELEAVKNEYALAKDQFERQEKMYIKGLVSQTQLQQRSVSYQNSLSKKITIENKIAQTKQEYLNIKIELNAIEQDYNEKISKVESEQFQALSQISLSQGDISKLENSVTNYRLRNGMYTILASQDGQIIQLKKAGIGEVLKEGESVGVIVPAKVNHAVEMFVRPVDLPLISIGQKVRFTFDGYPSIIFSGWPENSYGTFGGKIVAFESSISDNGMFRVLVQEDKLIKKWPKHLKIGSGVQAISLLKNVPIWYEVWRNINGFPPDFYKELKKDKVNQKEKK